MFDGTRFVCLFSLIASLPLSLHAFDGWTPVGPPGATVLVAQYCPVHPGEVLVGTQYAGLFRSTDGGGHFASVSLGVQGVSVNAVIFSPANPDRIFAGTSAGLFVSTDHGATWNLAPLPYSGSVNILATSGADPQVIYVAVGSAVLRSTDGGATFHPTGSLGYYQVSALTVSPKNSDAVVAGILAYGIPALFRSTDGGRTWSPVAGFENAIPTSALWDRFDESKVYVTTREQGFLVSTDGGATWQPKNNGLGSPHLRCLAQSPFEAGQILAGSEDAGLWQTRDGGENWQPANQGLLDHTLFAVAFDPHNRLGAIAGGAIGPAFTVTGGATWTPRFSGLQGAVALRVVVSPSQQSVVYAVGNFGVARSNDDGTTWEFLNSGIGSTLAADLAFDPNNPTLLFLAADGNVVYRSTDGGGNWSPANNGLPTGLRPLALLASASEAGTLWVAGGFGVYRSRDGGGTWHPANLGLPTYVPALAQEPSAPHRLYAATLGGLYVSEDQGERWEALALTDLRLADVAVSPSRSGWIAVASASTRGGVFTSNDGGMAFFNAGLAEYLPQAVAFHPNSNSLYIGTATGGAFRNDAQGPLTVGLRSPNVKDFAFAPQRGFLYCATAGGGVHRSRDAEAAPARKPRRHLRLR